MAGLEIQIGADTSDLEKGISDAEKQLRTLERRREARVRIGADVGDLDRRISQTTANLTQLRNSLNQSSTSVQNFNRQTANGSNTLTQFSRIAQDAPFGIMGIGNNLTATAEAFANLSREAGGSGNALRAVASSMMGTGGILLAISLVTAGLTYMAQNGITAKDVFDKMAGTFDENAKALADINKEATKTSGEEIAEVKALTEVAKDNTLSMQKRLIAVERLQDQYPAYFGNLSKEKILNGEVASTVNDLSKALRERATATAIAGKLGELAAKRLELEEKRERAILEVKRTQAELIKANKGEGSLFVNEKGQFDFAQKVYRAIVQDIKELDATSKKYSDRENQATKDSILLLKEKEKEVKKQKTFSTPQVSGVQSSLTTGGLADVSGKVVQIAKDVQGAEGVIATSMKNINVAFDMGGVGMMESLQRLNEGFSDIINNGLIMTLSNMGDAIGSALASGGNVLKAAGTSLLSSLGSILSQLGQMAIATGIGIKAIQVALKSLNPYVAIAAGVALVAIGGAVSAKSKSLGSSMGSGSGGGNYDTGANYSSPASGSSYSSGGSSFNGNHYVFEIEGQKLVSVLSNTLGRNTKLGGSLGI